jgi:DNA anti-recombination protein RmuC
MTEAEALREIVTSLRSFLDDLTHAMRNPGEKVDGLWVEMRLKPILGRAEKKLGEL